MALHIDPPLQDGGVDYDGLHMRTSVHSSPENQLSPFGCTAQFRAYRKNGEMKQFAPLDKISLLRIDFVDIEATALKWAQEGRLADAQLLSEAKLKYEQALALLIEEKYPNLSVEVTSE